MNTNEPILKQEQQGFVIENCKFYNSPEYIMIIPNLFSVKERVWYEPIEDEL